MILAVAQLEELTGYSRLRPKLQIKALQEMGIRHWVRPDGKPVVDSSALEGDQPARVEPNLRALA